MSELPLALDPVARRKARPHRYDPALQGHKLTIAYRGTDFAGWQRQPQKRTVQETLEVALGKIWGQPIVLQGSGRTDTGVHALGQVASFLAPRRHSGAILQRALNANLPADAQVVACRLVTPAFHARFDACGKTYRYQIWNSPILDPFAAQTHWHVPRPLDLRAMRRAARSLVGTHDFASFTSNPGYRRESTVRSMHRVVLVRRGPEMRLTFSADGFLYRMVRNFVGALVKVGLGRLTTADFCQILAAKSRAEAPPTAPACGLFLIKVYYPIARRIRP